MRLRSNERHVTLLSAPRVSCVEPVRKKELDKDMKKIVRQMAMRICLSGMVLCGCSDKVKNNGTVSGEIDAAVESFNRWIHGGSRNAFASPREMTPEEAMGLEKPDELAMSVTAWAASTELGDYYRQSRENLAGLYKKLIDDFNVRSESGVGATEYTRELMRNWREAYNLDYNLRKFILECYSRKEIRPFPPSLRTFTAKKEAEERLRQQIDAAKAEIKRLSAACSALKARMESVGDVAWHQKKGLQELGTRQETMKEIAMRSDKAAADAEALVDGFAAVVRANGNDGSIQDIGKAAEQLKTALSTLSRTAEERLEIANGQMELAKCTEECAVLESELASLKSEFASAGTSTWADEKDSQTWRERHELISGIASRAEKARASAASLVQRARLVVRASKGDATVAAFGKKAEVLNDALSEMSNLAAEQVTIAGGKPRLMKCTEECTVLEAELANLKAVLEAAEPISWTDEKEVAAWRELQGPAAELQAKAAKASASAFALAESVKPVVRDSKGDKTVVALDARAEQLKAALSAVAKRAMERLAIVKGQVFLTKFANECRAMADGMTKIPAAIAKKTARMAEIGNIEQLVRSSRTRNYSDLDELAKKTADVKARSLSERSGEIALGQRVQKLVGGREQVMGSAALYRLRAHVPDQAAHARIVAELDAFKRMVNVASDSSLPSCFASIESKAYQLADVMEEDGLLERLEETLRIVQRLAARRQ